MVNRIRQKSQITGRIASEKGGDYQDLYAILRSLELLRKDTKLEWVVNEGINHIEDIVECYKDGTYRITQVKYSDQRKSWTINRLISDKEGEIIPRFAQRWKEYTEESKRVTFSIVSNQPKNRGLLKIEKEIQNIKSIHTQLTDSKKRFFQKLKDSTKLTWSDFWKFVKCLDLSELPSKELIEEKLEIKRRLIEQGLGAKYHELHSIFKELLQKDFNKRIVNRDTLLTYLGLSEADITPFSHEIDRIIDYIEPEQNLGAVEKLLKATKSGVICLLGGPGTGKTTLLNELRLREDYPAFFCYKKGILERGRYRPEDFLVSLVNMLDQRYNFLSFPVHRKMPLDQLLKHFEEAITSLSEIYKRDPLKKKIVIIVDALDVAYRESKDDNYNNFIKYLGKIAEADIPEGVIFLISSQSERYLKESSLTKFKTLNIKPLTFNQTKSYLKDLNLTDEQASKIYYERMKEKGHPLHLYYIKKELKDTKGDFDEVILKLPQDFKGYYERLWSEIKDSYQDIRQLGYMARLNFAASSSLLYELLSKHHPDLTRIAHFIFTEGARVSIEHDSFRLFILEKTDSNDEIFHKEIADVFWEKEGELREADAWLTHHLKKASEDATYKKNCLQRLLELGERQFVESKVQKNYPISEIQRDLDNIIYAAVALEKPFESIKYTIQYVHTIQPEELFERRLSIPLKAIWGTLEQSLQDAINMHPKERMLFYFQVAQFLSRNPRILPLKATDIAGRGFDIWERRTPDTQLQLEDIPSVSSAYLQFKSVRHAIRFIINLKVIFYGQKPPDYKKREIALFENLKAQLISELAYEIRISDHSEFLKLIRNIPDRYFVKTRKQLTLLYSYIILADRLLNKGSSLSKIYAKEAYQIFALLRNKNQIDNNKLFSLAELLVYSGFEKEKVKYLLNFIKIDCPQYVERTGGGSNTTAYCHKMGMLVHYCGESFVDEIKKEPHVYSPEKEMLRILIQKLTDLQKIWITSSSEKFALKELKSIIDYFVSEERKGWRSDEIARIFPIYPAIFYEILRVAKKCSKRCFRDLLRYICTRPPDFYFLNDFKTLKILLSQAVQIKSKNTIESLSDRLREKIETSDEPGSEKSNDFLELAEEILPYSQKEAKNLIRRAKTVQTGLLEEENDRFAFLYDLLRKIIKHKKSDTRKYIKELLSLTEVAKNQFYDNSPNLDNFVACIAKADLRLSLQVLKYYYDKGNIPIHLEESLLGIIKNHRSRSVQEIHEKRLISHFCNHDYYVSKAFCYIIKEAYDLNEKDLAEELFQEILDLIQVRLFGKWRDLRYRLEELKNFFKDNKVNLGKLIDLEKSMQEIDKKLLWLPKPDETDTFKGIRYRKPKTSRKFRSLIKRVQKDPLYVLSKLDTSDGFSYNNRLNLISEIIKESKSPEVLQACAKKVLEMAYNEEDDRPRIGYYRIRQVAEVVDKLFSQGNREEGNAVLKELFVYVYDNFEDFNIWDISYILKDGINLNERLTIKFFFNMVPKYKKYASEVNLLNVINHSDILDRFPDKQLSFKLLDFIINEITRSWWGAGIKIPEHVEEKLYNLHTEPINEFVASYLSSFNLDTRRRAIESLYLISKVLAREIVSILVRESFKRNFNAKEKSLALIWAISEHSPLALKSFWKDLLKHIEDKEYPHLLIREYAKQALLNLIKAEKIEELEVKKATLEKINQPLRWIRGKKYMHGDYHDFMFVLPYADRDFEYLFNNVRNRFQKSAKAVKKQAIKIAKEIGFEKEKCAQEDHYGYWDRKRNIELKSNYYLKHALLILEARYLDSLPVRLDPEPFELLISPRDYLFEKREFDPWFPKQLAEPRSLQLNLLQKHLPFNEWIKYKGQKPLKNYVRDKNGNVLVFEMLSESDEERSIFSSVKSLLLSPNQAKTFCLTHFIKNDLGRQDMEIPIIGSEGSNYFLKEMPEVVEHNSSYYIDQEINKGKLTVRPFLVLVSQLTFEFGGSIVAASPRQEFIDFLGLKRTHLSLDYQVPNVKKGEMVVKYRLLPKDGNEDGFIYQLWIKEKLLKKYLTQKNLALTIYHLQRRSESYEKRKREGKEYKHDTWKRQDNHRFTIVYP